MDVVKPYYCKFLNAINLPGVKGRRYLFCRFIVRASERLVYMCKGRKMLLAKRRFRLAFHGLFSSTSKLQILGGAYVKAYVTGLGVFG